MKNKKLHLIAIATAVVISFLTLVPSEVLADISTITEAQISSSGTATNPDIYGNTIVWQDTRSGESNIYMYDISTKKETRITKSGFAINPAIYGNLIVWQDGRNGVTRNENGDYTGNWSIYMYDASTKKETRITSSGSSSDPDIYDNKIVYIKNSDIYIYDLSTKKETQITKDELGIDYPTIYGNKISWISTKSDEWSSYGVLYVYDLSTKNKIIVSTGCTDDCAIGFHDICNNMIVWIIDSLYDGQNIYVYDFSIQKETQITNGSHDNKLDVSNPRIYGDRIVWQEGGYNSPTNICMFDLSTKNETQITTNGSSSNPCIYGDRIVWQDCRNRVDEYGTPNGYDIYMATLSNSAPSEVLKINDFTAKIRCGTAPLKTEFFSDVTGKNIVKWRWDFEPPGKDYYSQHAVSAKHTFIKSGVYDITLTVWNAADQKATLTKKAYVVVKPRSK